MGSVFIGFAMWALIMHLMTRYLSRSDPVLPLNEQITLVHVYRVNFRFAPYESFACTALTMHVHCVAFLVSHSAAQANYNADCTIKYPFSHASFGKYDLPARNKDERANWPLTIVYNVLRDVFY